jgi:hypothetical protein
MYERLTRSVSAKPLVLVFHRERYTPELYVGSFFILRCTIPHNMTAKKNRYSRARGRKSPISLKFPTTSRSSSSVRSKYLAWNNLGHNILQCSH